MRSKRSQRNTTRAHDSLLMDSGETPYGQARLVSLLHNYPTADLLAMILDEFPVRTAVMSFNWVA